MCKNAHAKLEKYMNTDCHNMNYKLFNLKFKEMFNKIKSLNLFFFSILLPLCHADTFSHGLCLAPGNKLTHAFPLCESDTRPRLLVDMTSALSSLSSPLSSVKLNNALAFWKYILRCMFLCSPKNVYSPSYYSI